MMLCNESSYNCNHGLILTINTLDLTFYNIVTYTYKTIIYIIAINLQLRYVNMTVAVFLSRLDLTLSLSVWLSFPSTKESSKNDTKTQEY